MGKLTKQGSLHLDLVIQKKCNKKVLADTNTFRFDFMYQQYC